MKMIAVNGSPRKRWNTGRLLEYVVAGAKTTGMDAELVHIYDYDFKGCTSCFACKRVDGTSYGRCAMRDGLTPLLDEIRTVSALVLGSPLYFMTETGEMRSFMERVCFPYIRYSNPPTSLAPRRIPTAFVYTMNAGEELAAQLGLADHIKKTQFFMEMAFGPCEMQICYDTLQYEDYKAYENVLTGYSLDSGTYYGLCPSNSLSVVGGICIAFSSRR